MRRYVAGIGMVVLLGACCLIILQVRVQRQAAQALFSQSPSDSTRTWDADSIVTGETLSETEPGAGELAEAGLEVLGLPEGLGLSLEAACRNGIGRLEHVLPEISAYETYTPTHLHVTDPGKITAYYEHTSITTVYTVESGLITSVAGMQRESGEGHDKYLGIDDDGNLVFEQTMSIKNGQKMTVRRRITPDGRFLASDEGMKPFVELEPLFPARPLKTGDEWTQMLSVDPNFNPSDRAQRQIIVMATYSKDGVDYVRLRQKYRLAYPVGASGSLESVIDEVYDVRAGTGIADHVSRITLQILRLKGGGGGEGQIMVTESLADTNLVEVTPYQ